MDETVPTPDACPVKTKKKRKPEAPKIKKAGRTVSQMIIKAVSDSKERSGLSLTVMKKSLAASGYDVEMNNSRVNRAVRTLVNKDTLLQTKGTGASGSFRVNKTQAGAKEKSSKKKAAPKPRKAPAKKKAAPKRSPKKDKRPAARKTTRSSKKVRKIAARKAPRSPKKARKTAARKAPRSPNR
ncbi:histone H1-like, partial [Polyodon spathula]